MLGEAQAPTPHLNSDHVGAPTAEVVTDLIEGLCARQGLDPSDVPICIGLPGMMRRDGRLVYARPPLGLRRGPRALLGVAGERDGVLRERRQLRGAV